MSSLKIVDRVITIDELLTLAKEGFGDFVKAVVDIERRIMAVGGELHSDEEQVLLEQGSKQSDLWGCNIYPEKSRDQWFETVFSPEQENAVSAAHQALLDLAVQAKRHRLSIKQQSHRLDLVQQKFCFIPCYDVIDTPWTREHFVHELKILLRKPVSELEDELRNERRRYHRVRQSFHALLGMFRVTKRDRELLIMAHKVVFLKDERDDYRRLGSFRAQPLMAEVGRRFGLSIKETAAMSIDETRQALRSGLPWPVSELRGRAKGFVILYVARKPWFFASAEKAQSVLRRELGNRRLRTTAEVRGVIGSAGKARGRVAIVHTKHDLRRVKNGDVMVSVTTNPDYVPAMRKCVAIVTDEGGITSHAAIVCRELRIPCIVATGQGTKVLRDGDRVEVDATRGIVTRLGR